MEVHGGFTDGEAARLGIDAAAVLDFSANVNPRGPSPAVLRAIREAPVDRYPDPHAAALRATLARAPAARDVPVLAAASPLGDGVLLRVAARTVEEGLAFLRARLAFAADVTGVDPFSRTP